MMEASSYTKSDQGNDDENQATGSDTQGGQGNAGENDKKNKRRTRNDPDSRNFTCGCGKSYLSYAALYTHIKTKHEGIPPTGTSQPNNNGKSGRGRPKKEDSAVKTKDEDKSDEELLDAGKSMTEFLDYLNKLGTTLRYDNQNIKDSDNAITSSGSRFDYVQNFPVDIFPPNHERDYQPILDNLKAIKKNQTLINSDEIDASSELKKTKLNKIFAIFLYQLASHVREEFYKELCFFVCMYRKSLNELGWKTRQTVTQKPNDPKEAKLEFCEVNNGEFAPDICNEFITDSLPDYLNKEYDKKHFKVIGATTEQTKHAIFLTQYFCNWLNANKFTNSRLSINPEGSQS